MCGRFAQTNIIKATSDIVKTVIGKVDNIDNFNISPGQEAAVVKKYSNGRALELAKFSIFPSCFRYFLAFSRCSYFFS